MHVYYSVVRLKILIPSSRHARASVLLSSDILMSCIVLVFSNSSHVISLISTPETTKSKLNDVKGGVCSLSN